MDIDLDQHQYQMIHVMYYYQDGQLKKNDLKIKVKYMSMRKKLINLG
jgi:hypothetical protein